MKKSKFNPIAKVVDNIGKQFYDRLKVVAVCMNVDIKQLLNECEYNTFWTMINEYYNDYNKECE